MVNRLQLKHNIIIELRNKSKEKSSSSFKQTKITSHFTTGMRFERIADYSSWSFESIANTPDFN